MLLRKSSRILLGLACLAAGLTPVPPVAAAVSHSTVFKPTTKYACVRIPAIVRSPGGKLLAFAEGRKNDCRDTGDIDIILSRSTDNGVTWEDEPRVVVAGDGQTRHNPVPVVHPSGRIVLLSSLNYRSAWVQASTDDGETWSDPVEITSSVKLADWRGIVTGPSHAIVLARGPHAGLRIVAGAHYATTAGDKGGALLYSDDAGITWRLGAHSHAAAPGLQVQELSVFERPDGSLYAFARNERGTSSAPTASAVSTDGGASFTGPFTAVNNLVVPVVQASTLEIRATDRGNSYNRILLAAPSDSTHRLDMMIRSTFDGGRTWQTVKQGKVIHAGHAAYSDLVAIEEDEFGVLHEGGDTGLYQWIRFSRFTEADLDVPADAAFLTGSQDSAALRTTEPGQRHVFAVSSAGEMTHWFQEESTWQVKRGTWASNVSGEVVAYLFGKQQHAFARGQDGSLQHRWWTPDVREVRSETWAPAGSLAGSPAGFPTAYAQHIFGRGTDGSLRHWWWDGAFKQQTWGAAGTVAGDPVAIRFGEQQHVFAAGAGGDLLHWWWQAGAPIRQESWGGSAAGAVTALIYKGQLDVFARNTSGRLAHWHRDPGSPVIQRHVWGNGAPLAGRPISFIYNQQRHVVARDTGNTLVHWWWDPESTSPHFATWAGDLHSDPMALVTSGQQHVFGAAADGQLTHWWWETGQGVRRENWGGDIHAG
jgi:hypothetical protein